MSMVPVYVRARDGAWYRNPVIVFAGGYLCFDDESPPELVLWLLDNGEAPDPKTVLDQLLGGGWGYVTSASKHSERVVPGSEPFVFQPAASVDLELGRRIPLPTMHEGFERRLSRVGPHHAIDIFAHPNDPYELEI